jgi:hypothetical protein
MKNTGIDILLVLRIQVDILVMLLDFETLEITGQVFEILPMDKHHIIV